MTARLFVLYRHADPSGISGTGTVAEGTQWSDGTVSLRWKGPTASFSNWDSLDVLLKVHGHNGATEVRWLGEGEWSHLGQLADQIQAPPSPPADDCDQEDRLDAFHREDR